MAEKNIIMQRKTASGYDKYYPETKAGNVRFADGTTVEAHKADYTLQVPYGVATGTANNYAVTLNPAITAYTEGMAVAVKINVTNTGASTININGKGAKSIRKPNGNAVSTGNLKAGSIYSMRYNGTNFILQGEGGEYGTATAGDVLTGKTIGTESGIVTGSMPNQGAKVITPGTTNKAILAGYHNGSGYVVGDVDLVAENIKQGVNIFGVVGSYMGFGATPSDTVQIASDGTSSENKDTMTLTKEIKVGVGGIVRVKFTMETSNSSATAYGQIYVNGVAKGTLCTTTSTSGTTFTEDIGVEPNSLVQIYTKRSKGYGCYIWNFRICYDTVLNGPNQVTYA